MQHYLHYIALVAVGLTSLVACQRADNEVSPNQPITLLGEWRLAVSGGGLTGVMSPVPTGLEHHLIFGSDSAYADYSSGVLREANIFHLRSQPSPSGSATQQLLLKTTNSPGGQPYYRVYYVTLLTADKLNFTTGDGCPLNAEYVRVSSTGLSPVKH